MGQLSHARVDEIGTRTVPGELRRAAVCEAPQYVVGDEGTSYCAGSPRRSRLLMPLGVRLRTDAASDPRCTDPRRRALSREDTFSSRYLEGHRADIEAAILEKGPDELILLHMESLARLPACRDDARDSGQILYNSRWSALPYMAECGLSVQE